MNITRNLEIWAMALWVEKTHGDAGWLHIAQQQDRLIAASDFEGVKLWRRVGMRLEELKSDQARSESN